MVFGEVSMLTKNSIVKSIKGENAESNSDTRTLVITGERNAVNGSEKTGADYNDIRTAI
jgi:hypothetical protein